MQSLEPRVRETLDEIAPPRPSPDRWDELVAAAAHSGTGSDRRTSTRSTLAAIAGLAAAIVALALAWPFGGGTHGTLLERAAAAIGDGPVLHVVVESGFSGTQVDLATGERTVIHGEDELWYDPQRGVHSSSRFAGVLQGEETYPPGRASYLDKTLAFLATDYRDALRNGTARLLGEGTVDGQAVYWIRVDTQMLPDVADGKLHEWAHDVAVAKDTLRPVATRETRDGKLSPDGISRVESVESLPAGEGDFSRSSPSPNGTSMSFERRGHLTMSEARAVLGTAPLSAGDRLGGLKLARISKDTRREGFDQQTHTWASTNTGVTLYYGAASGGGIGSPPPSGGYLQISETTRLDDQFQRGVRNYSPPEGSLLLFGPHIGAMRKHGIFVALEGSSERLLIAAARALEPVTRS